MKKKKLRTIWYIMLGLAILLLGYSFYIHFTKKEVTKDTPKKETPAVEEKELQIVDLKSDSRPIAVMINNVDVARPYQSGLQDAYLVYEMIVEGGITRLMAIFKDQTTERIGSVRSSRNYYLDYALENDAIYVHFGWSPQAKSDMTTLGVNNINGLYDSAFWRDSTLNVAFEHTAFTNIAKIETVAKNKGYRTTTDKDTLLNYSVDEVDLSKQSNAQAANTFNIKYSNTINTGYTYNTEEKVYYRSVNGRSHVDYVTKKQYTAKNIIVAYVDNCLISDDYKGRQELENIGTGNGYYITDGYAIPITWTKTTRKGQTIYKMTNGEEITVNDGNTFIQIAPPQTMTISE